MSQLLRILWPTKPRANEYQRDYQEYGNAEHDEIANNPRLNKVSNGDGLITEHSLNPKEKKDQEKVGHLSTSES